jgi:hypothetical protein
MQLVFLSFHIQHSEPFYSSVQYNLYKASLTKQKEPAKSNGNLTGDSGRKKSRRKIRALDTKVWLRGW